MISARYLLTGAQLDGTFRFHARGQDVGQFLLLGSFSEYAVVPTASVIKLDDARAAGQGGAAGLRRDDRIRQHGAHRRVQAPVTPWS